MSKTSGVTCDGCTWDFLVTVNAQTVFVAIIYPEWRESDLNMILETGLKSLFPLSYEYGWSYDKKLFSHQLLL